MPSILFLASPGVLKPLQSLLNSLAALGYIGSTLESAMRTGEDWRQTLARTVSDFDSVALFYVNPEDEAYLQAPAEHLRGMLIDRERPALLPLVRAGIPIPDAVSDVTLLHYEADDSHRLAQAIATTLSQRSAARPQEIPSPTLEVGPIPHVVILLHGIRTQAEWQEMIADALSKHGLRVFPIRYQYFDALRFLLPLRFPRTPPIRTLEIAYRDLRKQFPTAHISIIAHSFGTYCLGEMLLNAFDCKWHRIVLVGSVLQRTFPWHQVAERYSEVVNDCGWRDVWPVLAQSVGTGYGASGTFGFGSSRVRDRFYRAGHSDLLSPTFAVDLWLPFLMEGRLKPGDSKRPKAPLLLSLLTVIQLKYVVLAAMLVFAFALLRPFRGADPTAGWSPTPTTPTPTVVHKEPGSNWPFSPVQILQYRYSWQERDCTGFYLDDGKGRWAEVTPGTNGCLKTLYAFSESKRDDGVAHIYDSARGYFMQIPLGGGWATLANSPNGPFQPIHEVAPVD